MIGRNTQKIGISVALLIIISTIMLVPVQAKPNKISVQGHARAIVADDDRFKDDIQVSIVLIAELPEGEYEVLIEVSIEGPEGEEDTHQLYYTLEAKTDGNSLQKYETTFYDFVSIKGFYKVNVSASIGDMFDSFSFKFDPPGGTMGPILFQQISIS